MFENRSKLNNNSYYSRSNISNGDLMNVGFIKIREMNIKVSVINLFSLAFVEFNRTSFEVWECEGLQTFDNGVRRPSMGACLHANNEHGSNNGGSQWFWDESQ